jgi:hypothetical protein
MRNKLNSIKNHVSAHRAAYAAGATATAAGYLMYKRAQEWNEFLKEHGIYDEFYSIGMED